MYFNNLQNVWVISLYLLFVEEQSIVPDYKPDYFAVISSILLFFVILFVFAVFETYVYYICINILYHEVQDKRLNNRTWSMKLFNRLTWKTVV